MMVVVSFFAFVDWPMAPKTHDSARTPLFERLVDADPDSQKENRPSRTLDRHQLKESVRQGLEHLLSTRCFIPEEDWNQRERTVIDYGIPDFAALSPKSPRDRKHIGKVLQRIIPTFEPRSGKSVSWLGNHWTTTKPFGYG